jgi:peptidoglycan hydrolase CwlO-like protein
VNRVAIAVLLLLGTAAAAPIADQPLDEVSPLEQAQNTLSEARTNLIDAQQDLETAKRAYQHMRHYRGVRGAPKRRIIKALANAKDELAAAEEALDAATSAARRAGVAPGWFRENLGALPASQTQD